MTRVPMIDDEWVRDCIKWHGRVLTGRFAHWCSDWDDWPMDANMIEFATCTCYSGNPEAEALAEQRQRELDEINEKRPAPETCASCGQAPNLRGCGSTACPYGYR